MKSVLVKKLIVGAVILASVTAFVGCGADSNKKKVEANKPVVEKVEDNSNSVASTDKNNKSEQNVDSESAKQEVKSTQVHFIDTGNSDAILISGEKTVLIDGGDNNDEEKIVSYLKKQNISKVDYMIATHNHADHIGGLDKVLKDIEVGHVFVSNGDGDSKTYQDFIKAIAAKKVDHGVPIDGSKIDLGNGAYMKIYNTNGGSNTNDESLITLYVNGNDTFLFTGDAEEEAELEVLDKMIDVDVLKVGHHGSKTSSSPKFLEKVNPEVAVITVGKDNKYKHPDIEVMDRLKKDNIDVYRTDENGTIIMTSTGDGVKTTSEKGSYDSGDSKDDKLASIKNEEPKPNIEVEKVEPQVESEKDTEPNVSQTSSVWKSATGEKYHTINDCGRMNPDKATKISIDEAKSAGLEDCEKC